MKTLEEFVKKIAQNEARAHAERVASLIVSELNNGNYPNKVYCDYEISYNNIIDELDNIMYDIPTNNQKDIIDRFGIILVSNATYSYLRANARKSRDRKSNFWLVLHGDNVYYNGIRVYSYESIPNNMIIITYIKNVYYFTCGADAYVKFFNDDYVFLRIYTNK